MSWSTRSATIEGDYTIVQLCFVPEHELVDAIAKQIKTTAQPVVSVSHTKSRDAETGLAGGPSEPLRVLVRPPAYDVILIFKTPS